MASPQQSPNKDTLIAFKVHFDGTIRRFKLPLGELIPTVLPAQLRLQLGISDEEEVIFKRYSDSANGYVTLDPHDMTVWKSLYRAAKAKLKLRITATLPTMPVLSRPEAQAEQPSSAQPTTTVRSIAAVPSASSSASSTSLAPNGISPPRCQDVPTHEDPERNLASIRQTLLNRLNAEPSEPRLAFRTKPVPTPAALPYTSWSVFCNHCDKSMENEHYHCSVCDNGDYDLCDACVAAGVHCPGEGHWLVKRFVDNGSFINSQTRKLPPKLFKTEAESIKEMPGTFKEDKQPTVEDEKEPETEKIQLPSQSTYAAPMETRTCNSCIGEYPDRMFVTCADCDDYDICEGCHVNNRSGHHPGHVLQPVDPESASYRVKSLCGENRSARHNAICDGCDRVIYGIRHKCLNCPDWDYCSECVTNAHIVHPTHRFAKIYERLADPRQVNVRHFGIYCDGPLCKDKTRSFIEGVRYKCAICHDTDFCGNCEASPVNRHNRTHPLIKFKTPVRNVSVTTMNEDRVGSAFAPLGDRPLGRPSRASESTSSATQNAASPVQTVYETKPSEASRSKANSKIDIKDLLTGNEQDPLEKLREQVSKVAISEPLRPQTIPVADLNAHFVRDAVADASKVMPNQRFVQTWTLRNPGPHAWPLGCSVRFVGGDHMLNVASLSGTDYHQAAESNIVSRAVQPGEEIDFRVLMKAPERKGAAISYWRLKNPEGEAFGHKLWCHVIVESPPVENVAAGSSASARSPPEATWPHMTAAQRESLRQFNSIPPIQRFEAYRSYVREVRSRLAAGRMAEQEAEKQKASVLESKPEEKTTEEKTVEKTAEEKTVEEKIVEEETVEEKAVVEKAVVEEMAKEPQPKESVDESANANGPVNEPAKEEAKSVVSQMIFPTLEKESPIASIHEANQTESAPTPLARETIASPLPSTVAASEAAESELFEDAETVDYIDSASDSEGFVTDEEWDVLGASDEETM